MDDDLEDSLKRLFQDSRLDMRVAPDAEKTVVRGARRVRRRRVTMISAVGVMSLAVLAGGTFLLARPAPQSTEVASPPTTELPITTTSPTTEPATAAPSAPSALTPARTTTKADNPPTSRTVEQQPVPPTVSNLGPTGFGSLRLGMTEDQIGTGRQPQSAPTPSTSTNSCVTYPMQSMPGVSTLTVSKRQGLVAITVIANASTPQGITIGSTEDQVRAAYRTTVTTTVPGNSNAEYRFRYTAGKVSEITLAAKQSDCLS